MPLKLVRREGSENWYIRGTVRGTSVFESSGTDDKEAAEAIRINKEGRLLKESVFGKSIIVTFYEAAIAYMEGGGSRRFLGTYNKDTQKWSHLMGHFKTTLLKDIGQDELDAAAELLYPRASPQTRNRQCYTPFVAVWNFAAEPGRKWAEQRTWSRPHIRKKGTALRFRPQRAGTHPVTYERAARFVVAMSPAPAMVMTALFFTGMRPIELFALQAADVSVKDRWLVVQNSKTGERRGVPMHEFLVPLFSAIVASRKSEAFLNYRGQPYPLTEESGGQIASAINFGREVTGIADVSPYTARHSVSTQLVLNGIHPHIKDQILGHAVTDMSRHYTNIPQTPLIEAINTLPVPTGWRECAWWSDPIGWCNKVARRDKEKDAQKSA